MRAFLKSKGWRKKSREKSRVEPLPTTSNTKEQEPDPVAAIAQEQKVPASKAGLTLEELNKDAAKVVYKTRLASNEIRLINVHPGGKLSAIECSTSTFARADPPLYEALSYVWGSQDGPKTILLDGVAWHVTANLYSALLQLRLPDRLRSVWIDALAINQTDLAERNEQVKHMSSIYANASTTLIWLGNATDISISVAFEILKGSSKLSESERRSWLFNFSLESPSLQIEFVSAMNNIFRLEYWKRIWVVQEILFSERSVLMYGQDSLAYDELFACMREICGIFAKPPLVLEALPPGSIAPEAYSLAALAHSTNVMIDEVIPVCGAARRGKYMSLREWRTAQLKRSTDRRDKVFGFYGCFHPTVQEQIQVDYSKTLPDLMPVMMRLLLQDEGLSMLFGPRMSYDPKYGIPSWVWSLMEPASVPSGSIGTLSDIADKDPGVWCAGGSLPSFIDFTGDGKVLHVRGKVLATIEAIAPPFLSPPRSTFDNLSSATESSADRDFSRLMDHFRMAWRSFDLFPEFPSTLGFITAFWLGPSSPVLSELANWLGVGSSGSLDISRAEYTHLIDSFTSLHFHRRMFYFMPADMVSSADPAVQHIKRQIHGESGLGAEDVAPGDKICVLQGCPVPVVLRQEEDQYLFLGEAYVPRAMHGEAALGVIEEEYEDFYIR